MDSDGWGEDAPPVTRTQLEKVAPAYQPTKVNLGVGSGSFASTQPLSSDVQADRPGVVKGAYQPVGKVDIAAIRRQAQQDGTARDDRPEPVKGSYEPVGKVDIAAIRARAQPPVSSAISQTPAGPAERMLPDRSAPFNTSERLTSLPKPKVANRFGAGTSSFTGTKAPTPSGFGEVKPAPVAGVGRTYADQAGKTPAQLWAEKKARERGEGDVSSLPRADSANNAGPIKTQPSGDSGWKSSYQGKTWAPVQTSRTGQSAGSVEREITGEKDDVPADTSAATAGGVGALRDRFKPVAPSETREVAPAPPPLDTSSKPNAGRGIALPGLAQRADEPTETKPSMPSPPPQPPRSPTPPTPPAIEPSSPIRIARPIGRGTEEPEVENAREEQTSPPPVMPVRSLTEAVPKEEDLADEPEAHDPARGAGAAAAAATFGEEAARAAPPAAQGTGHRAIVQYDYEKGEDNEIELKEGDQVINIDMVDENWWMGENIHGETGLFPSNYVELIEETESVAKQAPLAAAAPATAPAADTPPADTKTATALYDYEAAEDNELSFPENAKITNVVRSLCSLNDLRIII